MKRNPLVFVFDIEAAIAGIIEATDGKTLDEFKADWLMRHGVQRGIEIISEATRHLRLDLLARYPEIARPNIKASRTTSSGVSSRTSFRACEP